MGLISIIRTDFNTARTEWKTIKSLGGDTTTITEKQKVLSSLIGDIDRIGFDDGKRQSTDAEALALVKKVVQNNKTTIDALYKNNLVGKFHDKLTPHAERQIKALQIENTLMACYLPTALSIDELSAIIIEFIDDNPDTNIGVIMSYLRANHDGAYDGKEASALIRAAL